MPSNQRPSAARAAALPRWLALTAAAFAALAALVFTFAHSSTSQAASAGPTVSTAKTKLGRILVNSRGHALYLFEKDKSGKSACSGQCAKFWPPLIASAKPRAEGGVKAALLGRSRRADGRMQVTYNRHPLYTFVKDTKRGQTNGEDFYAFGDYWYAVSPAGRQVGG
jgi:predicted lipoprotein with Yx(FWY)xxD motif